VDLRVREKEGARPGLGAQAEASTEPDAESIAIAERRQRRGDRVARL
jgi:hypothetical protein